MAVRDCHLDLGCGTAPRNPYGRAELFGVDIRTLAGQDFEYRIANLAVAPIPFADNSFASVSAFDFLEHVPRVLATADARGIRFPFVELMDEIWRVLVPDGQLYALTPAWPHADAFTDPTHVNVITRNTHVYFCGASPLARMYGFAGRFEALRVSRARIRDATAATPPRGTALRSALRQIAKSARHASRTLRGKPDPFYRPRKSYVLWELRAIKQ